MVEQSSVTKPTSPLQNKESLSMSSSTEHPPTSPTAGNDEADTESNKRSERKRRREKQRRSDLSNAFDELAAFIVQVEPGGIGEDDADKKGKKRKSSDGGEDSAGITRLDLIGRALRIMKRLYRENEERKRVIASIEGRGGGANDNVIVMVPTLAPSGDDSQPVARAAYPGSYHHSGAPPYYASAASTLSASAAVGNGHDPREYSMAPPPPHHAAYTSHWGAAAATGYGARASQPPTGLPHHLQPPGAAMRLPQHYITARAPGVGMDGLPLSHIPPGAQH